MNFDCFNISNANKLLGMPIMSASDPLFKSHVSVEYNNILDELHAKYGNSSFNFTDNYIEKIETDLKKAAYENPDFTTAKNKVLFVKLENSSLICGLEKLDFRIDSKRIHLSTETEENIFKNIQSMLDKTSKSQINHIIREFEAFLDNYLNLRKSIGKERHFNVLNFNNKLISENFYKELLKTFIHIRESAVMIHSKVFSYIFHNVLDFINSKMQQNEFSRMEYEDFSLKNFENNDTIYELTNKPNSVWNAISVCLVGNTSLHIALRILSLHEMLTNLKYNVTNLISIYNAFNFTYDDNKPVLGNIENLTFIANALKIHVEIHFSNRSDGIVFQKVGKFSGNRNLRVYYDNTNWMAILENLKEISVNDYDFK